MQKPPYFWGLYTGGPVRHAPFKQHLGKIGDFDGGPTGVKMAKGGSQKIANFLYLGYRGS